MNDMNNCQACGETFSDVYCLSILRGRPGLDVGCKTLGACRGAEHLVNPSAKPIVANEDSYAIAA